MIASAFCLRPLEVPTTSITSLVVAKLSEAQAKLCALNIKIEIPARPPVRVSALFLPHSLPSFSKKESASSCSLFQTSNLHSRRHRSSDLLQNYSQHITPTSATAATRTSAPSPRQISACSSKPMLRLIDIGGHKTDFLEIRCERPVVRVLVIPGNPGVVQFYENFASTLFRELGGSASITVISHIAHTELDWENGGLFSLAQQIEHKIQFLEGQMAPEDLATNLPGGINREPVDRRQTDDSESVPWILVGHSIGAHISLQLLRKFGPTKICHVAGLYPFLEVNTESTEQAMLNRLAHIAPAGMFLAGVAGSLGRLPRRLQVAVMRRSAGSGFGDEALKVLCQSVLRVSASHFFIPFRSS